MADMEDGGEEYELVPRNKIQDLQKQIETLKKSPLAAAPSGGELVQAMDRLSSHMDSLLNLFKEASEELRKEERDSDSTAKKLDPVIEKLDMVVDQNKKIAKAILTVADMVRELQERPSVRPMSPLPPGPMPPRPGFMPPPPPGMEEMTLPEPAAGMGLPPLTPAPMPGPSEIPPPPGPPAGMAPKKRGIFG
jgi:hypothetical protein